MINLVNTTVEPPRDVEREAQNTPQRAVLIPVDDETDVVFIECWYANSYSLEISTR